MHAGRERSLPRPPLHAHNESGQDHGLEPDHQEFGPALRYVYKVLGAHDHLGLGFSYALDGRPQQGRQAVGDRLLFCNDGKKSLLAH